MILWLPPPSPASMVLFYMAKNVISAKSVQFSRIYLAYLTKFRNPRSHCSSVFHLWRICMTDWHYSITYVRILWSMKTEWPLVTWCSYKFSQKPVISSKVMMTVLELVYSSLNEWLHAFRKTNSFFRWGQNTAEPTCLNNPQRGEAGQSAAWLCEEQTIW
jgi:hypothetical protein